MPLVIGIFVHIQFGYFNRYISANNRLLLQVSYHQNYCIKKQHGNELRKAGYWKDDESLFIGKVKIIKIRIAIHTTFGCAIIK